MRKILFVVCCLAAMFCECGRDASAQVRDDFGSWLSVQAVKSWDRVYAMARFEHRSYERMSATECFFGMAGAGYRFSSWLKGDVSYEFWKIPSAGDVTAHKAVFCVTGTLKRESLAVSLREKYELAFTEGAPSPSHTLRSRLRAQYSIESSPFTPYVMFEYFNGFGSDPWQRSLHYAGTEIRVADRHTLDFFYMFHLFPGGDGTACAHLCGAGYVLAF